MKLQTTYPSNNYPIYVEHGAIKYIGTYLNQFDQSFLLIDEYVNQYFANKFDDILSYKNVHKVIIPAGEKTKTFEQYQETLEYILSHHVTRNTAIIAVGGGATGDFAGFVAATLLRGVHFIQVPTTILAHDSSVGGKVGINSKQGKNLIGAFYRPTAVIYDLDFLKTLPFEQILSGYAEVYKHALLNGESATQDIEQHFKDREILQSLNGMDKYIAKGIETKLDIVVADEKEQGVRKFLNLGHTFGHAVEYYYKIPHGHAVMVGIIYQFIVANTLFDSKHDINHYIQYLIQLGYPLDMITDLDFETLYQYMLSDKKNDKQGVQMVLIRQFGDIVVQHVDQLTLQHACEQLKTYFKQVNEMVNEQIIDISGPLKGEIEVPGDKSMTHRAIMLASLAEGVSTIYKPLLGEDCRRTMDIFRLLGVEIKEDDEKLVVTSPGYQSFNTPHQVLYTGNSGTTTRLLAGLLSGLGIESVLSGDVSIGKRPMDRVLRPLKSMNANIEGIEDNYTPLIIKPSVIKGINYKMEVASAQVKSAILFASLFSKEPTIIKELDVSRNHTETMFRHFNIPIEAEGLSITTTPEAIRYIKPADFHVPGDISSAAFFIVAALITPGSDVTIHNVGINPTRSGIIDIVEKMGGNIQLFNQTTGAEPTASIRIQYTPMLQPITIEGELVPKAIDELPVIALLCTQAVGTSTIKDAEELKVKETNRIDTTADMLNLLGFELQPTNDGLIIHPSEFKTNATVDSLTDHRIGMMLAVASLLSSEPVKIKQFDAVNVSFPGFLPKLKLLENEG